MRTNTKKLLAIALVAVMMASAGCSGWGQDGPANDSEPNQGDESNASDDLEERQNDTNASEGDSSDESDTSASSGGDDSTESDGAPDDSGDSSDGTPSDQSDDGSGAEDSGSSGVSDAEPQSSSGDDSASDSDSQSDSDSSQQDSTDSDDSKDADDSDSQNDADTDTSDSSGDSSGDGDSGDDDSDNETNGDGNETGNETNGNNEPVENETTLTVTVVDAETGEPINDGEVEAMFPGWGYSFTAPIEDGKAVFETSDEGIPTVGDDGGDTADVEFNVSVDGYEMEEGTTTYGTVVNLQEDNSHTLELVKSDTEPAETNLSITLVEQGSGDPIEGVEVSIYLEGYGAGASATTNENGVAVFDPNDLPTEGEDRSDGKVRIAVDNFTGSGYTYPEGVESASTEIVLKEDNSMTIELVEEDPEPPGNGTGPPNETTPNETAAAV